MNKWIAIPALAGAVVLGGVAMVANANMGESKPNGIAAVEEADVDVAEVGYEKSSNVVTQDIAQVSSENNESVNALTVVEPGKNKMTAPTEVYITAEEAIAIAMKQATGMVTEVELDNDDGRVHYEIEIEDGTYEYEFEIDAVTGEIVDFDKEYDND